MRSILIVLIIASASFAFVATQTNCSACTGCYQGDWYYGGHYLNSTDLFCYSCPSNCKTCDSPNSCTTCFDNYTLGPDNRCSVFWPGCKTFDSNTFSCTACFEKYFANSATGYCEACPTDCVECNSSTSCTRCLNSTRYDTTNAVYVYIGEIYLSQSNVCSWNGEYGCTQVDASYNCISCYTGYYLVGSTCIHCPPNCDVCDSSGICSICTNGSYLNQSNSRCIYCPANCISCPDYTSCLTCKDGYGISENGSCTQCIANCKRCDSNGTTKCQECNPYYGYNPNTNSCESCRNRYNQTTWNNLCISCSFTTFTNSTDTCYTEPTNSSATNGSSTNSSNQSNTTNNTSCCNLTDASTVTITIINGKSNCFDFSNKETAIFSNRLGYIHKPAFN